ncbi:relaxin receptor 2 [Trichonephila clavipes]|nr:relaxin receptor 2 [Trichonephila clavipes]
MRLYVEIESTVNKGVNLELNINLNYIYRYLSIVYPLMHRRRTMVCSVSCVTTSWILSAAIAIIPSFDVGYFGDKFYGNNGLCLPLQIHDPFSKGWQYSMVVFCGINSLAFGFITYAYVIMFIAIRRSNLELQHFQQQQDRTIAKRFAFIVASNMFCWVPIIAIKILSISGNLQVVYCATEAEMLAARIVSRKIASHLHLKVNEVGGMTIYTQAYAFIAVFILPINSALNPVLYTLTTKLFKQQLARIVYTWRPDGMQVEGMVH